MTAAPLAERIIEKGLASDAGVINAIVVKYCDYAPLYRQAVMLEREAGLEIGRATLDGWVIRVGELRVGELLQPVVGAMRRDLVKASYLQADETPVPVQMHDRRGSSSVLVAIRQAGRRDGVRLLFGPRSRWTEEISGRVGRNFGNRRVSGIRKHRRAEAGACRLLGALSGLWRYLERMGARRIQLAESLLNVLIIPRSETRP